MQKPHVMAAALSILLFTACAPMNKAQMGGAGGAAAGAIAGQAIGHNTGATLIGAAVGGMLGYMVGNEMDKFDQQQLTRAYETAPSGQPVAWTNPDNHNQYQVIPQPAYQGPNNQTCRKAEIVAVIDGKTERTHSNACRNAYGQWQLQN
ncbi:glycine zipper domain-containing protein [Candidatus Electronema sp. JM]|uniref:glycine zipper domain-containing protein n=1 Tax=Candidatus Electronema sp. JM TaxID=3401571 RepID=UPI003AA9C8E7